MTWKLAYSKQAQKDAKKIHRTYLKKDVEELLDILREDPFREPPRYESLMGELAGAFSRRINLQHRLVYEVDEAERVVRVLRMWSHYGD